MNTTDTLSPFWARVCTIIKQAVGIWPVGAQRGCTQPRHPSNRDLRRKHLLTAKPRPTSPVASSQNSFTDFKTMARKFCASIKLKILLPLILLTVNGCASNDPVSGRIFNNASPYIVKTDNGNLYQVTWYSGYQGHAGDEVILTNDHGTCSMVSKNGSAQVFVKGN
jgi:hypothetical protein